MVSAGRDTGRGCLVCLHGCCCVPKRIFPIVLVMQTDFTLELAGVYKLLVLLQRRKPPLAFA
jgi:hypothetical protein